MSDQRAAPPTSGRFAAGTALLVLLCFAQFMLILDVVIVAVAMPSIQDDLHIQPADIQWVATAYALAFGGFMVSAGRAADLFGAKRVLLTGLVIFTAASVVCGVAQGPVPLFVARAVQGLGAALVSPAALALVTTNFSEGGARNRALGIWGAVSSAGAVTGTLIGGVLTDLISWRSIFLINLPIGVIVLLVGMRLIRRTQPVSSGRTDVLGASILTAGVVLLVTGISQAERGFTVPVWIAGGVGIALLALLVVVETRVAEPVIRMSLFRNPNIRYGNVICVVSAAAALTSMFFSTLYMQHVLGMSPLLTGLAFVPITLAILVVASKTGALVGRFGVNRLLIASTVLIGIGLLLLSFVRAGGNYWVDVLPGLLISGVGAGLSYGPSVIVSTTGVADHDQGLASGLLSTSQQVGGAIGLAVLNTVVVYIADADAISGSAPTEALAAGYRAGFLWSLVAPVLMLLSVLALARKRPAVQPPAPDDVPPTPAVPAHETR